MADKKTPGRRGTVVIDGRPWDSTLVGTKRARIKQQIEHLKGNLIDLDRIEDELNKKLKTPDEPK